MLIVQSCTRACKGKLALLARRREFQSLHKPTSTVGEQAPIKTESLIRKHIASENPKWRQRPQKEPFFSSNTASPRPNVKKRPHRIRIENNGAKQREGLQKHAAHNGKSAATKSLEDSLESKHDPGSPRMPRQRPDKAPHTGTLGSVKSQGAQDQNPQELTHFEELFPFEAAQERARKAQAQIQAQDPQDQITPHHRPLEFSHVESTDNSLLSLLDDEDHSTPIKPSPSSFSSPPPFSTQPSQRLSLDPLVAVMLVLNTASPSLSEADFRRIAPKGKHIKEWTGPGELLKVFPGRDPRTLQQLSHYFLLFRNIEHARIYREHVRELHERAKERMPTSMESPLTLLSRRPSLPGSDETSDVGSSSRSGDEEEYSGEEDLEHEMEEEDLNALPYNADDPIISAIQDYALIPPSQSLDFSTLKAPFSASRARLLHNEGYADITRTGRDGEDRTGRAVLFYAEGCREFSLDMIRHALAVDNWQRGMVWQCVIHKIGWDDDVAPHQEHEEGHTGMGEVTGDEMQGPGGAGMNRWILTFREKEDARRFVRRWHLKAFPMGEGEEDVNVSAEMLW